MQVLHTIHPVGDYSELRQCLHTFEHNDLELAYYEINHTPDAERVLSSDTVKSSGSIVTTHSSLCESYIIVDGHNPELFAEFVGQLI